MSRSWERTVVAGDVHVPFEDARAVRLFLEFCRYFKPDVVVLNGDILDMWEVSFFDKDPRVGKSLKEEIDEGRIFLKAVRDANPTARIIYIEGNHEFRLQRFVITKAPELVELEGITLAEQLHCKEFGVEMISSGLKESDWQYGSLYIGHYDRVSKHAGYTAKALVDDKLVNIMQNHTHRGGSHFKTTRDGRIIGGWENFSLCQQNPTYMRNPNWQQGWSVIYRKKSNGRFQVYPLLVVGYEFFWGNKHFQG